METSRAYWFALTGVCNVLFWGFLIDWITTSTQPSDVTYVACCTLISAIAGLVVLNPLQSDSFEPLKLVAFIYGWSFGLGPLLLAPEGHYKFQYLGGASDRLLSEGAFLALVGWLMLLAGYYLYAAVSRGPKNKGSRELSRGKRSVITTAGTILLLLGGVAYVWLVYGAGGLSHFIYYTGGRADIFNGVFGGLYWATFFLLSGLNAIGCAHVQKHPVLVLALALAIGVVFIPFQGREEVLAPAICGLLLIHYGHKRISMKWITVAACILLVMASFLAYFRSAEKSAVYKNTDSFVSTFKDNFGKYLLVTLAENIEQMDVFLIAIRYVETTHRTLDGSTLVNWLEPIDKHILGDVISSEHPGRILTILIHPEHRWSQTALSPSILGELYLNFAEPGIIVGLFVYGLGLRFLYEKISAVHYDRASLMLYPYLIWIISKSVVDGTVLLFRPLVVVVPTMLIYFFLTARFRPSRTLAYDESALVSLGEQEK
ncbi:MAG TPA: O-antigen polysaccharide polymerase Wzy [Nitrospira sp.]|nr:O-antigen polysaccharide polymerase Wzy [Nitrospira sp.]